MMGNIEYGRERLKDILKKEASEDEEKGRTKEIIDLTASENERALNRAYRSSGIPGVIKADIDSYLDQAKPQTKALTEDQLRKMYSAEVITTLWVKRKELVKLAITLHSEDTDGTQNIRKKRTNV